MPTIKTKKEMTAHELITYGIQNNIKNIILEAINEKCKEKAIIHFNENAMPIVSRDVNIHHVFEVEVEEEITEDTVIPKMVSIGRENQNETNIHYSVRIGQFLDNEDFNYYVLNDDDTLTLIWRDGKLEE